MIDTSLQQRAALLAQNKNRFDQPHIKFPPPSQQGPLLQHSLTLSYFTVAASGMVL